LTRTLQVLGIVAITWLIIADQSDEGIFDKDCLKLAELHSDAVDYQKSGQPVPLGTIPRLKFDVKPDWNAPETIKPDPTKYYKSTKAIGKLFRAIDLPAVQMQQRNARLLYRQFVEHELDGGGEENKVDEAIHLALSKVIPRYISPVEEDAGGISHTFDRFSSELFDICANHTLSNSKAAILTEEEAIMGTIVAKSSQPRRRKELMSKLREQTEHLVRGIREQLAGDEDSTQEQRLNRAWFAWKLSIAKRKRGHFGAHSFGWIALAAIFEAMKDLEGEGRLGYL
jgi:RNA-dependent RNA polymerase